MLGVYVTVPVACFRKGLAREYLETELVPPPSTCYGFLLSLVGETQRKRHAGAFVTPMLLSRPERGAVLRTIWRVKKAQLGSKGNARPDYQQLLTGTALVIWLDSSGEAGDPPTLEMRVSDALNPARRGAVERFGGLALGESTHLVDEVSLLTGPLRTQVEERLARDCLKPRLYRLAKQGLLALPVWVDHVGSADTVHVVGEFVEVEAMCPPAPKDMPRILPPQGIAASSCGPGGNACPGPQKGRAGD